MNVLLMSDLQNEERKYAEKKIDSTALLTYYLDLNEEEKKKALQTADIIVGGRLTDDQLSLVKQLKFHQILGTGLNRHKLSFYKENDIILCNNHSHASIIAEHGYSLLHAASKELDNNDKLLREGDWDHRKYQSVTLFNKTILFLGFGEIAKHFKKMCKPFSMRFLAIKRTKDSTADDVEFYTPENILEAVKQADFIFNSLPGTENTENFLDEKEFAVMKPTAIIVNVGRGMTINAEAMYKALKDKKIKAAAIDVWYNYPQQRGTDDQEPSPCFPSEYPFQNLDNIIMSAHRAWNTDLPRGHFIDSAIPNINNFIKGLELKNIVNLDEGY